MAYNNDWSITEIAGISDLRDSYQWKGEKRLWQWALLRRINNYSSSNAGRYGTVISNTTPNASSIPQVMTDTTIQKSATRYGGGIRYYAIPGFLVNGQNIIALGGVNVEHATREQAYNHVRMTWGDGQIEPSKIKNWGYFGLYQYPTILLGCETFSTDNPRAVCDVDTVKTYLCYSYLYFITEAEGLPNCIVYGSPNASWYVATHNLTTPTLNITAHIDQFNSEQHQEYDSQSQRTYTYTYLVTDCTSTVTMNDAANITDFTVYKVKGGGANRIPIQTTAIYAGPGTIERTEDREQILIRSGSLGPSIVARTEYFYLEPGTYYYKLEGSSVGTITLSGKITATLTTTWASTTTTSGGYCRVEFSYSGNSSFSETPRPLLIKKFWNDSRDPDICWESTRIVNSKVHHIEETLFYISTENFVRSGSATTSTDTVKAPDYQDWPGWKYVTDMSPWGSMGYYRWVDGGGQFDYGTRFMFRLAQNYNINCRIQHLMPWCLSNSSYNTTYFTIDSSITDNTTNPNSWTIGLPDDHSNTRTFNTNQFQINPLIFLPFTSATSTRAISSDNISPGAPGNNYTEDAYAPANTSLFASYQISSFDRSYLIATYLKEPAMYFRSIPKCAIVFDEAPVVYFIKNKYSHLIILSRYSYMPYWGTAQISTSTYPNANLSLDFFVNYTRQHVDFPVPTSNGSTTATVGNVTLTWYGPENSNHPGEIVHPSGFSDSFTLSPYVWTTTGSSGNWTIKSPLINDARQVVLKTTSGSGVVQFEVTQRGTPAYVSTGSYRLQYLWMGDAFLVYRVYTSDTAYTNVSAVEVVRIDA